MLRRTVPRSLPLKSLVILITSAILSMGVCAEVIEILPGQLIQTAIRQATEDTTIRLLPGIHRENIRVDRSIKLIGDPAQPEAVILEGRMAGPVIIVTGSDPAQQILIEGLTIRGASGFLPDGILYLAAASIQCSELIIENCQGNGITVAGSGAVLINDCLLRTNGRVGIDVQNETSVVEGSGNSLRDNGADLGGFASPSLRTPLVPQTSSLTIQVPEQYRSLQEAVDAVPEGGTILVGEGDFQTGLTIWKSVSIIGRGQAKTTFVPVSSDRVTLSILSVARSVALQHLTLMVTEPRSITAFGLLSLEAVTVISQSPINQDSIFKISAGGVFDARDSRFEQIGGVAIQALADSSLNIEECSFSANYRDVAVEGSANVTITGSRFDNTRLQALEILDSSFLIEDCIFEACMDGLIVTRSSGIIRAVESTGAARNAIGLYDGANVILEECVLTGSGNYNLWIAGDAIADLSFCTLSQAKFGGIAASDASVFTIRDSSLSENLGAGLILAGQAGGEVSSSIIQGNGKDPILSVVGNELFAGGVIVSMNSHLILRATEISGNEGAGVLLDPANPFQDRLLDPVPNATLTNHPSAELYECSIRGNNDVGVAVHAIGQLSMVECNVISNTTYGILLDGTAFILSGGGVATSTFKLQDIEGIEATLKNCEITDHVAAGVFLDGLAAASIADSGISLNSAGILMDLTAQVDLRRNNIFDNGGYGVWFKSEDCGFYGPDCIPESGQLTGFGNMIPESWEEYGNGMGAFSAGSFPCLVLPEGCGQEE